MPLDTTQLQARAVYLATLDAEAAAADELAQVRRGEAA
jgi:hypothetical protein